LLEEEKSPLSQATSGIPVPKKYPGRSRSARRPIEAEKREPGPVAPSPRSSRRVIGSSKPKEKAALDEKSSAQLIIYTPEEVHSEEHKAESEEDREVEKLVVPLGTETAYSGEKYQPRQGIEDVDYFISPIDSDSEYPGFALVAPSPQVQSSPISEFPGAGVSALSLDQLQKLQELVSEKLEEKDTVDVPEPTEVPVEQFMWSEF